MTHPVLSELSEWLRKERGRFGRTGGISTPSPPGHENPSGPVIVPYGKQGLLVRWGVRKPRTAALVRPDELIAVLDGFVRADGKEAAVDDHRLPGTRAR